MKTELRTHNCGALRASDENSSTTLCGFIQKIRSFGAIVFIDLKDRYGVTQLVCDSAQIPEVNSLHMQDVIQAKGTCRIRKDPNPDLPTGQIEIEVESLHVLSSAKVPPFELDEHVQVNENLRLQYRYLDMRVGSLLENLAFRHKIALAARQFLDKMDFLEIETPILGKSTPEGARDFLVPSRVHPGQFYALPQSPQQFKQLLMIAGADRYFQIAKCFRDEDLRADRQLEFTQIDIEMSFATIEDLQEIVEKMMTHIFSTVLEKTIETPFVKMSYHDCLEQYGSDKPDLRYDLKLHSAEDLFAKSSFELFQNIVKDGGIIKGIRVPQGASFSRKQIGGYEELVRSLGLKGLAYLKYSEEGIQSPLKKFFSDELTEEFISFFKMEKGDLLFFAAGQKKEVFAACDHLRRQLASDLDLIEDKLCFLWVEGFPLFEYDQEDKRLYSVHHPFTLPTPETMESLDKDPLEALSTGYDLVLNGYELAGGSSRIYQPDLQKKIFSLLGLKDQEIEEKFGNFLEALSYGTPPHLGIAFGLDRLVMLMAGVDRIRDVIAFPKTTSAQDLTIESPTPVDPSQLDELNIALS